MQQVPHLLLEQIKFLQYATDLTGFASMYLALESNHQLVMVSALLDTTSELLLKKYKIFSNIFF